MQKQIGAIMLVAGTCIGSGMIALPMVLVKLGIIPSIILILLTWAVVYYTSLITVELNLQAGQSLSLGALGKYFSGIISEIIGTLSLKLLLYSVLSVYIYGGASILQKLLSSNQTLVNIESWYAIIAGLLLLFPIKFLDYTNRILFIGLIAVLAVLILSLTSLITWENLPLTAISYNDTSSWYSIMVVMPVIFTSFGFQGSLHSIVSYCNKDILILRKAIFWGCLIPALVYIIWTVSTLTVISHKNPMFYQQMMEGKIEVGDLVKELSNITQWTSIQLLVWWISLLAIITSMFGVCIGLFDSLKPIITKRILHNTTSNIITAVATILPSYIVAVLVPNAFIAVLGFAGMILVIIAILLPAYLLHKASISQFYNRELKSKILIRISVLVGIFIIICEIINMVV